MAEGEAAGEAAGEVLPEAEGLPAAAEDRLEEEAVDVVVASVEVEVVVVVVSAGAGAVAEGLVVLASGLAVGSSFCAVQRRG